MFTSDRRAMMAIFLTFAAVATLAGLDIIADLGEGTSFGHVAFEAALFILGLVGSIVVGGILIRLTRRALEMENRAETLTGQLSAKAIEAEKWRQEARELLRGLSIAIDRQFESWQLSPAEKEVGLLLLKGLSHREVAAVRHVTEATARQQARALYRKAGLSGRNDLAAFFLEDLMFPREGDLPTRRPGSV